MSTIQADAATPETDRVAGRDCFVSVGLARRLERERDTARAELKRLQIALQLIATEGALSLLGCKVVAQEAIADTTEDNKQ